MKRNTLRNRLMLIFFVSLFIPCLILAFVSYQSAKMQLQQKMEKTAASNVMMLNQTIDQIIQLEMANVQALSDQISSEQIDRKDKEVRQLIESFIRLHPEISSLTLGNEHGAWMKAPNEELQNFDPRSEEWYQKLLESKRVLMVSEPHRAASGDVSVNIGISLPDGKGAIGIELGLGKVNEIVKTLKFGANGYAFIVDKTNTILAHPFLELGDQIKGSQFTTIQKNRNGVITYQSQEGQTLRAFYETNNITGWKIIGVLQTKEFAQASMPIVRTAAVVMIISLVLTFVLLFLVIRRITRPIEQLVHSAKRVSDGYLSEEVAVTSKDEIGELAASFNV
ncbi:MAG TPA: cache domain-containing protein, partial [Bacilli bacterium]